MTPFKHWPSRLKITGLYNRKKKKAIDDLQGIFLYIHFFLREVCLPLRGWPNNSMGHVVHDPEPRAEEVVGTVPEPQVLFATGFVRTPALLPHCDAAAGNWTL